MVIDEACLDWEVPASLVRRLPSDPPVTLSTILPVAKVTPYEGNNGAWRRLAVLEPIIAVQVAKAEAEQLAWKTSRREAKDFLQFARQIIMDTTETVMASVEKVAEEEAMRETKVAAKKAVEEVVSQEVVDKVVIDEGVAI